MVTMITTSTISRKKNWNEMETCPMLWMWWTTQKTYWILSAQTRTTVKAKCPTPLPKPKMNTHPTHTHVWVGWGLQPLIVPIGVDVFCCCLHCSLHTLVNGWVFQCIRVFFVHFLEHWCVCVEGVFCPK